MTVGGVNIMRRFFKVVRETSNLSRLGHCWVRGLLRHEAAATIGRYQLKPNSRQWFSLRGKTRMYSMAVAV